MEEYSREYAASRADELRGIYDSHCHYDDSAFDNDRGQLLDSLFADDSPVDRLMHASVDKASSEFGIAAADRYERFFTSVGFHPEYADAVMDEYGKKGVTDTLAALAAHPKVKAVGEIGLDYHYDNCADRAVQSELFEAQTALAVSLDLPVIIHCRDALEDVLRIVKKYRPKGVIHCFSGSAETAIEFVRLGMYIGFTGVLSFKNAKKVKKAFLAVPQDRFLFETDCPYMSPEPFRGKRCDSRLIAYTALEAQRISGVDAQKLIDKAAENAAELFGV